MKINYDQLVELLVEKTGYKEEDVREQLTQLVDEINTSVHQGEKFKIERFGSFIYKDGQLHFEPANELQIEINNKYAGMEPIELIGAYRDSEGGKSPQEPKETIKELDDEEWPSEEDIWGFDEDEISDDESIELQEQAGEEASEPVEEQQPEPEETHDKDEPEEEQVLEDKEEPVDEGDPEEEKLEAEAELKSESSTEKELDPESKPKSVSPKKSVKYKGPRTRKRKKSSTYIIMFAAAAIIIIAAGVWIAFNLGAFNNSGANSDGNESVAAITQNNRLESTVGDEQPENSGTSETQTEGQENSAPGNNEEETTSGTNSEPETDIKVAQNGEDQSGSTVYGLKGKLNPEANDGYTIVVYSLENQQRARKLYRGLKDEGYRTLLVSAFVSGDEFWRVALGQFKTVENAQKQAANLPAPFDNNFFIKSIR